MFPPPSEPPPPPPAPPSARPAQAFDDENETTHVFDKDRHALDAKPSNGGAPDQLFGDDETTRVFDKDKDKPADDDETTHVFDSDRHGPKRVVPARAGGTKIGLGIPKAPPVPSDRPAPAPALRTPPPVPPPPLSEKPGLKTIRVERRSDQPKPAPAPTVIVQEHTDPAIFRPSNSIFSRVGHWIWDDPAKRGFRVGLPAGFIVFFAVLFASSGHGGKAHRGPPRSAVAEQSEEPRDPSPKAAAVAEEPRGIDPSTLPPADDDTEPADDDTGDKKSKPRRTWRAPPPTETRVAAVDPTPAPQAPAVASPPKPAADPPPAAPPSPPKAATDDDIESPYAKSAKSPKPTAAQKPAAKPKKSAGADCSQPFTVDENGIKRIRPECL